MSLSESVEDGLSGGACPVCERAIFIYDCAPVGDLVVEWYCSECNVYFDKNGSITGGE